MSEEVLNKENWVLEVEAVIKDVKDHVEVIEISKTLKTTDQKIYLNISTLEGRNCCVELSTNGFRIVGNSFDETGIQDGQNFETPYSLLNKISEEFGNSFGNALVNKLNALNKE